MIMKALIFKEWRENAKVAVLGLVIYALLLVVQYRQYVAGPLPLRQPLASENLLWSTVWFCGIFGAVLGWLQIHNERRPDLWAFLLHRPMTRTDIFLGKTLAGLGLYAAVVCVPLAVFTVWALWPGHVAAPFEVRILRPLAASILTGLVFYLAGMLTGLRQARWYGSRGLGLGLGLIVWLLVMTRPVWWEGFLVILVGGAMLAAAVWGGFQTHGHYRSQPAGGKAALILAMMPGSMIVVFVAAALLSNLFPETNQAVPWSSYYMTKEGMVVKGTEAPGQPAEIVDLEGKPLLDPKTGQKMEALEFLNRRQKPASVFVSLEKLSQRRDWLEADMRPAFGWRKTSDTLWYYWKRYGRLVGYDIATRRCIGSLGPEGFAPDLSGKGDRFNDVPEGRGGQTVASATTLYRVDLEKRTTKPLFTTTAEDPIVSFTEVVPDGYTWEYTVVATKRFVDLLTAKGRPVWKVLYEEKGEAYAYAEVFFLDAPGQYALWLAPSQRKNERADWKLRTRAVWLARDKGVVRSIELPSLSRPSVKPQPQEKLISAVAPPVGLLVVPWLVPGWEGRALPREDLLVSWCSAVLVCLPIGLWLGRRYRFSPGAQAGWAVFHVLFGVPGLLAFLAVQERPAREACPNCKRLRLVDRAQCEHCGAGFAPPEKTGTEVFAA
jgi:hypothetical protein